MDDVTPLWPSDECITRRDSYGEKHGAVSAVTGTTNPSTVSPHAAQPSALRTSKGGRPSTRLTIADICADLAISRSTFYEWRAKGRAPRCIKLPNGDIRINRAEYERWLATLEEAA
jgi:predicted DNA-binding transcriptional regulator AlpA